MQVKPLSRALVLLTLVAAYGGEAAAQSEKTAVVKISGFRYGLIDFAPHNQPRIYQVGNEFPFIPNGTCMAAGMVEACQWRGFEFSYKSPDEETVFECATTSDRPQTYVYPGAVVANKLHTTRWGFSVQGRTGNYIRPQYSIDVVGAPLRMENSCTHKGQEVLRWTVTLTPPKVVSGTGKTKSP